MTGFKKYGANQQIHPLTNELTEAHWQESINGNLSYNETLELIWESLLKAGTVKVSLVLKKIFSLLGSYVRRDWKRVNVHGLLTASKH